MNQQAMFCFSLCLLLCCLCASAHNRCYYAFRHSPFIFWASSSFSLSKSACVMDCIAVPWADGSKSIRSRHSAHSYPSAPSLCQFLFIMYRIAFSARLSHRTLSYGRLRPCMPLCLCRIFLQHMGHILFIQAYGRLLFKPYPPLVSPAICPLVRHYHIVGCSRNRCKPRHTAPR